MPVHPIGSSPSPRLVTSHSPSVLASSVPQRSGAAVHGATNAPMVQDGVMEASVPSRAPFVAAALPQALADVHTADEGQRSLSNRLAREQDRAGLSIGSSLVVASCRTGSAPAIATAPLPSAQSTSALTDGIWTDSGALSGEAIEWLEVAGLRPARATENACGYFSCGAFCFLNTGSKELAAGYFEKMISLGAQGQSAQVNLARVLGQLSRQGFKVRADLFPQDTQATWYKRITQKQFDLTTRLMSPVALRSAISEVEVGKAAMLAVDVHVLVIVRDVNGWHAFDTGLNPEANVYPGAVRTTSSDATTVNGANHVHGRGADELIETYINHARQAAVIHCCAAPDCG